MTENSKMVAELEPSRPMRVRSSFRRSAQGREIVIVLGMHRSGTSLLANVLHLLGVDMVDEPPHASPSNEKGFWERQDIQNIHDEILAVLGVPVGSTAHAVPFAAGWWRALEIRKLKEQLRDMLAAHLSHVRRPWGFKDPRTCRLLPLWGEILEELDISPRFVWAVRHPAESSLSMTLKNPLHRPIPVAQSEVMWLAYNYDILRHAGRHWPIIVPFDQWFEDPLAQARELARELDLAWQGSDHELQSALDHIVSGEHRHHFASGGKLRCNLAISEEIYRTILGIRNGEASEVSEATAVSLHSLLGAVQPFAIAAKDAKALKEENQTLATDIRQLRAEAAERDRLQASLAEMSIERDSLQTQLAAAKAAEEALHQDHVAAARKMDAFRSQLATANAAKERAETSLASTIADWELLSAQQKAASSSESAALKDEVDRLSMEIEGLRAEAAGRDRLQASLAEMSVERDSLKMQLAAATAATEKTEVSLASAIADMELLSAQQKAASSSESAVLKDEIDQLSREIEGLRADAAERDRLRVRLAEISAERDGVLAQLAAAKAAEDALHQDHVAAARKMDAFRSQLVLTTAARERAETSLASAIAEMELLHSGLAESAVARSALQNDLAAAMASYTSLQAELAAVSQSAAALKSDIASMNEEMAAMRAKLRAERERHAEAFQALLLRMRPTEPAPAKTSTMDS